MNSRLSTDFLAASGSVLIGMGSILNLSGSQFLYNRSPTPQAADALAIYQDFAMIGQDMADVMRSEASEA